MDSDVVLAARSAHVALTTNDDRRCFGLGLPHWLPSPGPENQLASRAATSESANATTIARRYIETCILVDVGLGGR
jgi:hypothetical protein